MSLSQPISKSRFTLRHLLIIGILILAFSVSFLIRAQPADFGYQLNEFDPFFNYRATQFIVENGIDQYFDWNDKLSWHPHGRDVSQTSQVMLHMTTAVSYWIFGGGSDLYEYTILFPAIIGSLSAIIIFALVRVIGGTTAGLLASVFFAISLPVIVRGSIGWFKSEPLGLFYGFLGVYLLLSGIKSQNHKITLAKLIGAGIFVSFALSSWGGTQFFLIPLGIFFLALPFVRNNHKFLLWAIPLFSTSLLITSMGFERLGSNFVTGMGGFAIIGPTLFLIVCIFLQNKSSEQTKTRNGLILLGIIIISGIVLLAINTETELINMPSFRYMNAINPFLTTSDPLVDSVAEHATTSIQQSFFFHSILMIFAGIGIWILLSRKNKSFVQKDMVAFSLIFGLTGVYISSAFVRLELFAAISVIILASLGLSILINNFKHKSMKINIIFLTGIILLLTVPIMIPGNTNPFQAVKTPPTILNGGTNYSVATNDWIDAMEWIKNNTPNDAVVASWWDYGYWIQTLGERATLADNSTVSTSIIQKIAKMLLSSPDDAWKMLQDMEANYVLVFVSGQKLNAQSDESYYLLEGGGDESKKQWFMRIANEPLEKYLHSDGQSGTKHFWENTLLGQTFPFSPIVYVNFQNNLQYEEYQPGTRPVYEKQNNFPKHDNGPLELVYASPSYQNEQPGTMIGVFIYEVNDDYQPVS